MKNWFSLLCLGGLAFTSAVMSAEAPADKTVQEDPLLKTVTPAKVATKADPTERTLNTIESTTNDRQVQQDPLLKSGASLTTGTPTNTKTVDKSEAPQKKKPTTKAPIETQDTNLDRTVQEDPLLQLQREENARKESNHQTEKKSDEK